MRKQGENASGNALSSVYVQHDKIGLDCSHDGRTRQEFADECDINILMSRYEKTGTLNHFSKQTPEYLDLGEVPDLHTALTVLEKADRAFMSLPAAIRREFDNDSVKFVQYAENPENLDRMREWGLAPPKPVEPGPVRVEVVNPMEAPK